MFARVCVIQTRLNLNQVYILQNTAYPHILAQVTIWSHRGVGRSVNPKKREVPSPSIPLPATSGSTQTFGLFVAFLCVGKARYKSTPLALKLTAAHTRTASP